LVATTNPSAGQGHPDVAQSQPSSSTILSGNRSQANQADNGDSKEEEPEAQGRKSQDDPLVSLVQGQVTPSKTTVNASREEQVEDISPTILEATKTLSRVASQKPKSIDKGRRYKRRKETKGKKVVTSLNFQEEVSTGAEEVEGVNTGSVKVSNVSVQ
ncbi:hypothetical protein Tco_1248233, partial [Tanacetum coccineum]